MKNEKTSGNWKKRLIVLRAKKGNPQECKSWRGITLVSVVSKVMGKMRLTGHERESNRNSKKNRLDSDEA